MLQKLTDKFYSQAEEIVYKIHLSKRNSFFYYTESNQESFEKSKQQLVELLDSIVKINPSALVKLEQLKKRLIEDFTLEKVTSLADRKAILIISKKYLEYAYHVHRSILQKKEAADFQDLSFDRCYQAVSSNVAMFVERLSNTFHAKVVHAKKEAVRQIAAKYVTDFNLTNDHIGNEVHYINTLLNYIAHEYNLKEISDVFAPNTLSISVLNQFKQTAASKINPTMITNILLSEVNFITPEYSVDSIERMEHWLSEANLDQGEKELFSSGFYLETESGEFKIPNYQRMQVLFVDVCLERSGYVKDYMHTIRTSKASFIQTNSDLFIIKKFIDDYNDERTIIKAVTDNDVKTLKDRANELALWPSLQYLSQDAMLTLIDNDPTQLSDINTVLMWSLLCKTESLTKDSEHYISNLFTANKTSLEALSFSLQSIFELLVKNNHITLLERLLHLIDADQARSWINSPISEVEQTPAYVAAYKGQVAALEMLHVLGADLDEVDNNGATLAHLAAKYGQVATLEKLHKLKPDLINKTNNEGLTPAHVAAQYGQVIVLKKLAELNIDLNKEANNGATPAHFAAYKGQAAALEKLRELDADFNKADNEGLTPAHVAAKYSQVIVLKKLAELNIDLNQGAQGASDGATPAHFAAYKGQAAVLETLHALGANLNKADNEGLTPVHVAAKYSQVIVLKKLAELNIDLNKEANNGATPAHLAAYKGQAAALETLHALGADLNKADNEGDTPICIAKQFNRLEVVTKLREWGYNDPWYNNSCKLL